MATETQTGLPDVVRGITVTTLACAAGVLAAFASGVIVGTSPAAATDSSAVFILGGFLLAQYPVLRLVGVDVGSFGAKDHLYVAFMTFVLWFMTFAILLTTGVVL